MKSTSTAFTPTDDACLYSAGANGPDVFGTQGAFHSVWQAADEIEDRGVDFVRALLLGPVAAAGQHLDVTQCRHDLFEIGEILGHSGEGDHQVMVARDIEGRDGHLCAGEGRHELPVTIDVAIVIEGTAKAAASEFGGIEIDVGF